MESLLVSVLTILGSAIWALGQVVVKPLVKKLIPLALVAWLAFIFWTNFNIYFSNTRWKYNRLFIKCKI
jgi:hypothetical protein